jgi:hypothetical protein
MDKNITEIPDITTHELISSYHDGLKEAVDFVQSKIIGILDGQINLSQQEEAVLGIFLRIHALASSLVRLNQKIDFNAVAVIARTLFELLLDLKLLSSPNIKQKELDRFFSFSEVDRFQKARRIVDLQNKYPELVNHSLLDSTKRKEFVEQTGMKDSIELKVKSLWGRGKKGKLKWPNHWSSSTIQERAKANGHVYEQEYLEVYSFLSSYAHGGSSAYSGFSKKALESVYGISLEYSRKMYIESLLICSDFFDLKAGIESFSQVITFLENAPKEILTKYYLKKIANNKNERGRC